MYNSAFIVSASRGNNTLTFIWNVQMPVRYTWRMLDGYYSAADINAWLQSKVYANNLYCSANTGSNGVYFFDIDKKSVRYYIPTSANATTLGYTKPSGVTWVFPTTNSIS